MFPTLELDKIDDAFPMDSYRDGQKACIEYAVNSLNNGKRVILLECPTGSGKSAIAMTLANLVNDSFYLTITKILQDQLTVDFPNLVELKGRSAYPCTFYQRNGEQLIAKKIMSPQELLEKTQKKPDCNNGFCKSHATQGVDKIGKGMCEQCFKVSGPNLRNPEVKLPKGTLHSLPLNMTYSACPYFEKVYKAIDARQVVMNFSSFLYQTMLTKRFSITRDLMIIDEAHNIEAQILDFVSFSISDDLMADHGIFIPELKTAKDYACWFDEIKLQQMIHQIVSLYETAGDYNKAEELDRLSQKLEIFLMNINQEDAEWIIEYHESTEDDQPVRKVTLKPVYARGFVDQLLFSYGKRVVLLSATFLDVDVMARSLGIDRSEIAAYRMKNRFPVANRPIYYRPVAKMTGGKGRMHEWMPQLLSGVEKILDQYPDQRGIIHTHNNAIMEAISTKIHKKYFSRLITQREFPDKKDMLMVHSRRPNSVIVAPAMHEGINLIDDLSRFQIICKVPYANFYENEQLARRVEVDPKYYQWMTAIKTIQSYGRSIRSETDYADTYVLDEAFAKFIKDAKNMLPKWFLEAIIMPDQQ